MSQQPSNETFDQAFASMRDLFSMNSPLIGPYLLEFDRNEHQISALLLSQYPNFFTIASCMQHSCLETCREIREAGKRRTGRLSFEYGYGMVAFIVGIS